MWLGKCFSGKMSLFIVAGLLLVVLFISLGHDARAAQMSDYCVTPPYIGSGIAPNLLLMIDNSASMYDLAYQDNLNTYCANKPTTPCSNNSTCSAGGMPAGSCVGSYATTPGTTTPAACTQDAAGDATCRTKSGNPLDYCVKNGPPSGRGLCVYATVASPAAAIPIACTSNGQCNSTTGVVSCPSGLTLCFCGAQNYCYAGSCPASATCAWAGVSDTCNNTCSASRQCYDNTYSDASKYGGYFNTSTSYSYVFSNNTFTSLGGAISSCTGTYFAPSVGTPYACVATSVTGTSPEAVTAFSASGNFLNWLTSSKFDIEKQILTGGKYDTTNSALVGENRGCAGRGFLKAVPGLNLTFAVRGGSAAGLGQTLSLATEYGQAYIDIYTGTYNATDCLNAMSDWMNITGTNPGTFQNDSKGCVGAGTAPLNPTNVWNHTLHNCYQGITGGAGGYSTNLNPLEGDCQAIYSTLTPSSINDPNSAYAVCSSVLFNGTDSTGYLGYCWNGTSWAPGACGTGTTTAVDRMKNYCQGAVNGNPVVDPASTQLSGSAASVPGFILNQGLGNLNLAGTLTVKVSASPPTGLINKYSSLIRFGAMTFQNNGSASECSTAAGSQLPCMKYCNSTPTRICFTDSDCPGAILNDCRQLSPQGGGDGGKIISYIGHGVCSNSPSTICDVDSDCLGGTCAASVGDHNSGLISSLDGVVASSWTPFAEGFYNAMGYYARSNNYPVPPATVVPTSRDDLNGHFNFTTPSWMTTGTMPPSYVTSKNPSQQACQKNNILLITDGMSTADQNAQELSTSAVYSTLVSNSVGTSLPKDYGATCSNSYGASTNLPVLTWVANNVNIKTFSPTSLSTPTTDPVAHSSESINTYIVYTGPSTTTGNTLCDGLTLATAAAKNGGTSVYKASNIDQLNTTLANAFDQVAAKAAAGTAASVLASGEGSGANLIQAVFYPHKRFNNSNGTYNEISWVGRLTNLWYYVDPFLKNSTIREDNGCALCTAGTSTITPITNATPWSGDKTLNLLASSTTGSGDYPISMYYDPNAGVTKAHRWTDPVGNGVIGTALNDVGFEDLGYLWEAGTTLWARDLTASPRTIKTSVTPAVLTDFTTANVNTLASYMTSPTNTATASSIISWVTGSDVSGYRSRSVMMTNMDNTPRVWKLGDILNSTPKLVSWTALNNFGARYLDSSYGTVSPLDNAANPSSFVTTTAYKSRGVVFAGGNDGMLHAFKLGTLKLSWSGKTDTQKAELLTSPTGSLCTAGTTTIAPTCGQELWAYIPKQALPYLQYLADPSYCHVNTVDLTPYIFEASINRPSTCSAATQPDPSRCSPRGADSWSTILIGGMRFGGACRPLGTACNVVSGVTGSQCVNTPTTDPADSTKGLGYSTYFALDVTDPTSPVLLWEFSDPSLGFTTSGPAIVRINSANASGVSDGNSTNGNWYVIFGSGPTGPISTSDHQFLGRSDQPLKLFVLDLKTGTVKATFANSGATQIDSTMPANAFSGSLLGAAMDVDEDYQDEVVYIPYVTLDTMQGTWTKGGVGRLSTLKKPDPTLWKWSTLVNGIGPVTSAVVKTNDRSSGKLWAYFGEGRYYFLQTNASDDPTNQRRLYGIKDTCVNNMKSGADCTSSDTISDPTSPNLVDATTTVPTSEPAKGWFVTLDGQDLTLSPNLNAERNITDPLTTSGGVVFFTTYRPYTDLCTLGGKSFIWAFKYNTGGAPTGLTGKVLVQVSSGAIEQKDLSTALTDKGGRRSAAMEGKPPEMQGLSVVSPPGAFNRRIHIRER